MVLWLRRWTNIAIMLASIHTNTYELLMLAKDAFHSFQLLKDFTCSVTISPSNLSTSTSGASRLANSAESSKRVFSNSFFSLLPSVLKPWVHVLVRRTPDRFLGNGAVWSHSIFIQRIAIEVHCAWQCCLHDGYTIPSIKEWRVFASLPTV